MPAQSFALCLGGESGLFDTDRFASFQLTGTVSDIARGTVPCVRWLGQEQFTDATWHFRLNDGATEVWVVLELPWDAPIVNEGDPITMHFTPKYSAYPSADGYAELMLRRGSGELLLWAGLAHNAVSFEPPSEIAVVRGQSCSQQEDCGSFSYAAFDVFAEGAQSELPYGAALEVGPYVFAHGGDYQSGAVTPGCHDWGGAGSKLLAIRGSLADLTARHIVEPCPRDEDAGCTP